MRDLIKLMLYCHAFRTSGPAIVQNLPYTEYGMPSGPGAVSFIPLLFIRFNRLLWSFQFCSGIIDNSLLERKKERKVEFSLDQIKMTE